VSSDQSSVEPAAAEPPVKATRSRRGRTPRLLASAQLVSETAAPAAEVVDVVQASGVEQVDQVERGQATETTATETTDGSPDPIGEALTALGRSRRGRTPRATRVVVEETSEGALDSLVQAIASSIDPDEDDDESEDAPSRRRRRRRGGRKRHREATEVAEDGETEATTTEEDTPSQDGDEDPSEDQGRRRRRRRRRRGEDVEDGDDQDAEVVVKVREPRSSKSKSTDIIGIDGSTRLEAKKQRRREGRAASRQRAPILSEAEFLARREAVERKMLIRQKAEYSQIAVIEDGVLVEHYVDRASATSLIGNIYLGKVQNVLPGMEAAFIDIGRGRNAVLYAGEVDWDSFGEKGQNRKIEDVFSAGQLAVVQVSKDPVGAKGARLTSHISIPGRYVVYAPKGHISGISRKLSETERNRLKSILDTLVDDAATVVIRTAAEGATEDELVHDVNRLKAQWEVIEKKSTGKQAPQLLYAEPDLTMRIVRDLFTGDFASLIVDGNGGMEDAYETVEAYVQHVAPHLADRIQRWDHDNSGDLFAQNRIDEQIAKALDRKVHLPSGGSLVIDRTEAMTVIDVNTGKFTGSGGNLEATVTSNNLEAAEEIVRQLRLRDIGGIIIVDFIDMVLPSNRELLLRRLVECLGRDRTRHQVSEVTSLGLVQLTRKKVGTGLAEAFTKVCEVCGGLGHIRFDEPVDTQAPADGGERHQARRGGRRRS
jgi:ribonuclease E